MLSTVSNDVGGLQQAVQGQLWLEYTPQHAQQAAWPSVCLIALLISNTADGNM
jgi:hypothetical protein